MERLTHFIILTLLFGLLIFAYQKSLPQQYIFISEVRATNVTVYETQDYTPGYYKLDQIWNSADKIANAHEYKLGIYDCTEFSRDLVKELKLYNISSQCVFGVYIKDDGIRALHTWVEITDPDFDDVFYVEATQGYVIEDDTLKEHYKIFSRGYCI